MISPCVHIPFGIRNAEQLSPEAVDAGALPA